MSKKVLHLRPYITTQHARWLQGAVFIDGYLYVKPGKVFYLLEVRLRARDITPTAQIMYLVEPNEFGLFDARKLMVAPRVMGVQTRVDNLNDLTLVQRKALRALLRDLADKLRASAWSATNCKFSIKIHALLPRPCDPMEGIRNEYANTGDAARDLELARRTAEKRLTNPNKP